MATDSIHEDPSLIALIEAAMARPAFQERFTQLSRALVAMVPPQAMWDAMGSSVLPLVQALAPGDRERVNQLLDEAYQAAASARQEPTEEQVAALAATVREFTSSQTEFIPRRWQKQAFVYFCGLVTLLALMQVSFQSETTDAVLDEFAEKLPLIAPVVYVAHRAWERYARRPGDDTDGQEDDSH
ncbi:MULTISPECIES: hypothetical protein [unclassified Streptomyces]|uniref:hypothetical protein n=1 Tax=unclassified Streptomyces TaxID=2593676 RepID=UPI001161532D|nr:hypothetical protein [Streptomyces sp. TSRI0107]